jgi:iron-sulfur cluster insertion protein
LPSEIKDMSEASTPISLTESAGCRISVLVAKEKSPGARLRVTVSGGGCSGFQYGFSLDDKVGDDDIVIEAGDGAAVIDSVSLLYLAGSEIDFVEELVGSYFTIRNPNATSMCGCGNSFGVAM